MLTGCSSEGFPRELLLLHVRIFVQNKYVCTGTADTHPVQRVGHEETGHLPVVTGNIQRDNFLSFFLSFPSREAPSWSKGAVLEGKRVVSQFTQPLFTGDRMQQTADRHSQKAKPLYFRAWITSLTIMCFWFPFTLSHADLLKMS